MTHKTVSGAPPTDHFAAGLEEYEGRTPEDAATTDIAVRNAVETIGVLMREDRQRREREGLPELALPDEIAAEIAAEEAARAPQRRGARRSASILARLRGFRPRLTHAGWAAAFGAVLMWPEAVLIALLAGFVICLVGVALFGPEILERLRGVVLGHLRWRDRARKREDEEQDVFEEMPDPFERLRDQRG